jgi:hypothetical protein
MYWQAFLVQGDPRGWCDKVEIAPTSSKITSLILVEYTPMREICPPAGARRGRELSVEARRRDRALYAPPAIILELERLARVSSR